jgi:transcriptional regulator with XRE-family HTH domain
MLGQPLTRPHRGESRSKPLLRTMLGQVLRKCRVGQGRTLADVAGAAKVSMQYLSELERGRKEASSEVLAALCDALEVGLPDVLAEVSRALDGATAQPAMIIRLGSTPRQPAAAQQPRAGDTVCLLAA